MGMITEEKTAGGIPVLAEQVPGSASAGFLIAVRTGSRDEEKRLNGISHLLEHTVFRETGTMDSFQMAKLMEGSGGELNAFTAKEMTGFYGITLKETSDVAMRCVADIVADPLISEKDTALEKAIVLQELSMVKSEPENYVHDLFEGDLWEGDPLGMDEGGTEESVNPLTHEDLRAYYSERYGRPSLAVFATGGIEPAKVTEWAEGSLDGMSAKVVNKRSEPKMPGSGFHVHLSEEDHVNIGFGFPVGKENERERYADSVLAAVLGAGTSSRLFQGVRERNALVYSIYESAEHYCDAGYVASFMSCTTKNVEKALTETAKAHAEFRKNGLEKEELKRTKNLLKGEIARAAETTDGRIYRMCRGFMTHGKAHSADETLAIIDSITEDEVMAAADRVYNADRLNVTVLGKVPKGIQDFDVSSLEI
jgi:predicted Zn-dependent peptidase